MYSEGTQTPPTPLHQAAAWLVRQGFPRDFRFPEPPPAALREAIIDTVHADPTRTIHNRSLTRDEVTGWLSMAEPAHRPTSTMAAAEAGEPPECSCGAPIWCDLPKKRREFAATHPTTTDNAPGSTL